MPNRNIKESCRRSRTIDALSDGAEAMFYRLTTVADDYGRFIAEPDILLAECYPLRARKLKLSCVEARLAEMVEAGLVSLYEAEGRNYGVFCRWELHQGAPRARASKHPAPPAAGICEHLRADAGTCAQPQTVPARPAQPRKDVENSPRSSIPGTTDPDLRSPINSLVERHPPPDLTSLEEARNGNRSPTVVALFEFWRWWMERPASKLTSDRRQKIQTRLTEGYPPLRIVQAIIGLSNSPFHRGENERHTVYDDIELICRKGSKLEQFIDLATEEAAREAVAQFNQQQP